MQNSPSEHAGLKADEDYMIGLLKFKISDIDELIGSYCILTILRIKRN